MAEIYKDSEVTLALGLVNANNVTAIVKRNNTQIATAAGEEFDLPLNVTAQDGPVTVVWSFDYFGESTTRTEKYDVVTPYVSLDELKSLDTVLAAMTDSQLIMLEQTVRNIINAFCGQTFGAEYKTLTLTVEDGMPFILPQRTWAIDSITTSFDPTNNIFGTLYILGPDGYSIAPYRDTAFKIVDWNNAIVTGPIEAPSIFPTNRDYTITVSGWFGWESVPSDINWAAKKLALSYIDNDNTYREKMVKAVTAQTWQLEYQDNSQSTGNVDVDRVLSSYFIPRMEVI